MTNDWGYVRRVLRLLADHGIEVWLFGGWAEELHGVIRPRPHKDIDLLCPADDFGTVDRFLAHGPVAEITAKHFPHKRAFELDGVMTELFLVRQDADGYYTLFWGRQRHDWPADLRQTIDDVPVASTKALAGYRARARELAGPSSP